MDKNTYCSYCSIKFAEQKLYPRICFYCGNTTYANPLPVVVVMATVEWIPEKSGIVIQKRNIEPKKGGWALPSGYINLGETWQQAASRELAEELDWYPPLDQSRFKLWGVDHSTNGNILIFCTVQTSFEMYYKSAEWFKPNDEVQAVDVICDWETQMASYSIHQNATRIKDSFFKSANASDIRELVFPSHVKNVNLFFESELWNQQKKQNRLKL